jgi:uncharacterized phage infection (PIP) family protein YhgE
MATVDVMNAIANEARKNEQKQKIAQLKGQIVAMSSIMQSMQSVSSDAQQRLSSAQQELESLDTGAGQGITSDFGPYSTTDQAMQKEREAGKEALIDYIKANPTCTEVDAEAQWRTAALAVRPADRQWLLQDPEALRHEYTANLMHYTDDSGVVHNYITDATWESFRAFIIATDKAVLLVM